MTNDDGIDAPASWRWRKPCERSVRCRSARPPRTRAPAAHKITLFQDIAYSRRTVGSGIPALAVGGSPADCIALSLLGLIEQRPISSSPGINRGENMAQDLTYSGTVTAALEAAIHGIPAVAFSLARKPTPTMPRLTIKVAAQSRDTASSK